MKRKHKSVYRRPPLSDGIFFFWERGDVSTQATKIRVQASSVPNLLGPQSKTGLFQTSCYCRAKLARLQHDNSATWFQTSNLIQSNGIAVAENKHKNKGTVQQTFRCILTCLQFMNWVRHDNSATFETKLSYCRVVRQSLPCYTAVTRLGFKRLLPC